MSHSIFSHPKLRDLPGDTFKLFLWLLMQAWRFPDSDGTFRASIQFISQALQMPSASVSRSLARLREAELIEAVKTDYRHGNVWRVEPIGITQDPQAEGPLFEEGNESNAVPAPSNPIASSIKSAANLDQIDAETRNTRKQETLSLVVTSSAESTEPAIASYLAGIQAPKKRESELESLHGLRKAYSESEIATALAYLLAQGTLGSGEPCHSPFRYLAHAMGEVLAHARDWHERRNRRERYETVAAAEASLEFEREAREEAELQETCRAFEAAFPSPESQEAQIEAFIARELRGIRPPADAARRLAARNWMLSARKNM